MKRVMDPFVEVRTNPQFVTVIGAPCVACRDSTVFGYVVHNDILFSFCAGCHHVDMFRNIGTPLPTTPVEASLFHRIARYPESVKTNRALMDALSSIGMTVRVRDGEYRVNFKYGQEATAYYTNDRDDARGTALLMVKRAWRARANNQKGA